MEDGIIMNPDGGGNFAHGSKMKRRGFLGLLAALPFVGALFGGRDVVAPKPAGPRFAVHPLNSIRPGSYEVHTYDRRGPRGVLVERYAPLGKIYVFGGYAFANPAHIWDQSDEFHPLSTISREDLEPQNSVTLKDGNLSFAFHDVQTRVLPNSWLAAEYEVYDLPASWPAAWYS